MPDSPRLAYRSIQQDSQHATVTTDPDGNFRLANIKLGEWILTVEADGFAPQYRRIQHLPSTQPSTFQLQPGRAVQGRVVDPQGQPIVGACVVLGHFHCHTDAGGHFAWSVTTPVPDQVAVKVRKRYSRQYTVLQKTMSLVEIEQQPIVLGVK